MGKGKKKNRASKPIREKSESGNVQEWSERNKGFFDLIKTFGAILSTIIAILNYSEGHLWIAYIFIIVACASADWLLWPALRQKSWSVVLLFVATFLLIGMAGVGLSQEYRTAQEERQKAAGLISTPATAGQMLVIVAKFDQRGGEGIDPATRIADGLRQEFDRTGLNIRVETVEKVTDENAASRIGQLNGAVAVIWGWYDAIGFSPHFTITDKSGGLGLCERLKEVPKELKDFSFYIREELPRQMTYFTSFVVGQALYRSGKGDEALVAFDAAIEAANQSASPQMVHISTDLTILHLWRGYLQTEIKHNAIQAIADYTEAIKLDPKFELGYLARAELFMASGNFESAIADYNQLIGLDPNSTCAYGNLGVTYYKMGNLSQALSYYNKVLQLDPENASAYYNRGLVNDRQDNIDQAIADYTKAIESDPDDPDARENRGVDYSAKGMFEKAIADYNKAIELKPNDSSTYVNRGIAFYKKGNLDAAIVDYNRGIALDSTNAKSYNDRALAYIAKGEFDRAIADCNQAINFDPNFAGAYFNRATAYYQKSEFDRAITDYTDSIRLDPQKGAAYSDRGTAYYKKGDTDLALTDYNRALDLNPNDEIVYFDRGKLFRDKGMKDSAVHDFETYLQLKPDAPDRALVEQWLRELRGQ